MSDDLNVPEELSVASGFGTPDLDAEAPTTDTLDHLDTLLDEAIEESGETITEDEDEDDNKLSEDSFGGEATPTEPEPTYEEEPIETTEQEPQIELDPEVEAIEQPRNLSEKNQSNWRQLQETATKYKKEAEEAAILRERLAQYQQQPQQLPSDYEELRQFRAVWDLKNDPSFKSKYEAPLAEAKNAIYDILKKNGANDEVINSIEKAGGPDKVDQSWWKNQAIDKLQFADGEKLKKKLIDVMELRDGQEKEVSMIAQNQQQWLAQKQQEQAFHQQQDISQIQQHVTEITKEYEWANFKAVPENATPEEISLVDAHNQRVSDLSEKFKAALFPNNATARAEVATAAVASHVLAERLRYEQEQFAALQSELTRLKQENSQLKQASRVPKPGNATQSSPNKSTTVDERIRMNAGDAIDMGLDEAGA
jgi:hypothetical protein